MEELVIDQRPDPGVIASGDAHGRCRRLATSDFPRGGVAGRLPARLPA